MNLQDAQIEYADAGVALARAKEIGDAPTITQARTALAQAQANLTKAKAAAATAPADAPESVTALKKENAELKARLVNLGRHFQDEVNEKWELMNKIKELTWALREAKGEKMPNLGAQLAYIPTEHKKYPPLDVDEFMREWDEETAAHGANGPENT